MCIIHLADLPGKIHPESSVPGSKPRAQVLESRVIGHESSQLGRTRPRRAAAPPPFPVWGSGLRVQGAGFGIQGSGFRVQGSGSRVKGSEFRF